MKNLTAALIATAAIMMPMTVVQAAEDVVIVYDASGSMWGQIDGVSKIEIARDVMADLINGWSDDTNLGLVAYGHRSEGDCRDIETLIKPGPLNRSGFIEAVNAIRPKGKTPISAAIQHAADALSYRDNPATVVLISDGLETCQADPCALAEQLEKQGVNFTAHVVGFDLDDKAHESLACIAKNTGGVFVPAQNASELKEALAHVQNIMDLKPMASIAVEQEQDVEPEPAAQTTADIELTAPNEITTGASFKIAWSASVHPEDYVTIVPSGADEGTYKNYVRVRDNQEANLTAPAEAGLYEVRYVLREGARTLASSPVEVTDAEIGIAGPTTVRAEEQIRVTWSASINPEDYITIVPAGADEGSYTKYTRVRDKLQADLKSPKETGLYEVRYVLREGARTLASYNLEVVDADAALDSGAGLIVPDQANVGETILVSWTGGSDSKDQRIAVARAEQADFSWVSTHRIGEEKSVSLKMPAESGSYEIRYLDVTARKLLGRAIVKVK